MNYPPVSPTIQRVLGIWLLLIPGSLLFQPVLGGIDGFLPSLLGITVGCLVGWLASLLRLSPIFTFLCALCAYFLAGGAVAARSTTVAGFIPTAATIKELAVAPVQGWRDILTAIIPAGDFAGSAAFVWFCACVAGVVASTIVSRTHTVGLALLVPAFWLSFGILFGVGDTWFAPYLGAGFMVGALAWMWIHAQGKKRESNKSILVGEKSVQTGYAGRILGAVLSVALTVGGSTGAVYALNMGADRMVLRDMITPPLDLRNYPSPLMKYRYYEKDLKDKKLFTIEGMPSGGRLKLATMDTYDGHVFKVSNSIGSYARSGRELNTDLAIRASVQVNIEGYSGVWVPTVPSPAAIEPSGGKSTNILDSLYYNEESGQIIVAEGLEKGDSYTLNVNPKPVVLGKKRDALHASTPGTAPILEMQGVPEGFTELASSYAEGAKNSYEQLVKIEKKLQEGYYSDGSDGRSRSGHTTERLTSMFTQSTLIGDDEQYATAMALMANSLGIPARVVMGFYPDYQESSQRARGDAWSVKGTHAHVWVEANFADAGWLTFDPTPSRDRVPEQETPRPKPKPKPQADSPPNPPEQADQEDTLVDQDPKDDDENFWPVVWQVLKIILITLLIVLIILSPFIAIIGAKMRRAQRRKNADDAAQSIAGSWDELVDYMRDTGYEAQSTLTRAQTARQLQKIYPSAPIAPMAQNVDAAIYGATAPSRSYAENTWARAESIIDTLAHQMPWHRRIRTRLSLISLTDAQPRRGGARFVYLDQIRRGALRFWNAFKRRIARTSAGRKVRFSKKRTREVESSQAGRAASKKKSKHVKKKGRQKH